MELKMELKMALKPWDDRPHPSVGDKRATTTYAAVGQALSTWERLEAKLAELFSQIVGGEWMDEDGSRHPAVRAFGSVQGSAARLTMIEEAAKAHFEWYPNAALQKRLQELIGTECRQFAGKRNNIAHGVVDHAFSMSVGTGPRAKPKFKLGHWLVPSIYATKKRPIKGPNAYAYTSNEIHYFMREFDKLWVKTNKLIDDISRDQYEQGA